MQLPFKGESCDTVVSFLVLHHVIECERTVVEATHVLRPGRAAGDTTRRMRSSTLSALHMAG